MATVFLFGLQPHPAAEAAAAKVIAQGSQDPPYVVTEDDDHASGDMNGYHDSPLAQPVYGAPPQPALTRQQTFGKVLHYSVYSVVDTYSLLFPLMHAPSALITCHRLLC